MYMTSLKYTACKLGAKHSGINDHSDNLFSRNSPLVKGVLLELGFAPMDIT